MKQKYRGKESKSLNKIERIVGSIPPEIRYALIAFLSFAIGVANWNKDFAIHRIVILPLIYRNFYILGLIWYILGFLLELFSMICIIILGNNRKFTVQFGIVYEFASSVNFLMFLAVLRGTMLQFSYELAWNTIFFFIQVPLLLVILLYAFNVFGAKFGNRNI